MTVMTTHRGARLLLVALVSWTFAGCGEAEGPDPDPHSEVTAADADVRLVDEDEANLVLHASNQSFDDEKVRLTIAVDDVTVVDGAFHVADQHNWVTFPLSLAPGLHQVTAKSDSGATLSESFEVPPDQTRYALIDHWGEGESADLSWSFQRQPMGFG